MYVIEVVYLVGHVMHLKELSLGSLSHYICNERVGAIPTWGVY